MIDPGSGLDAVLDVAVARGRVAEIGAGLPAAGAEFDVGGLGVPDEVPVGLDRPTRKPPALASR